MAVTLKDVERIRIAAGARVRCAHILFPGRLVHRTLEWRTGEPRCVLCPTCKTLYVHEFQPEDERRKTPWR